MFKPKLFSILPELTPDRIMKDVIAGIMVGIVALPLAIAFAIASGVSPEKGLITAVIGGFLVSFLGGSRVQIGGPTGAFIVILYGIVQQYGINGLVVATIMSGIILMIMGFAQFGSLIKFIPYPVIVGFTSGIAVIIFSSQVKDFLGLDIATVPADFIGKWSSYAGHLSTFDLASFMIGILALLIILFWPKISRKIPGSLIAIVATTVIVQYFHLDVATIQSRFGEIPSMIPAPTLPSVDFATIQHLIMPATTIALLGAIEALLSAVVADGMIGSRHKSNMELIAQGAANIITPPLWRHTRHRSNRKNSDQCQERRQNPCSRNCSRHHTAPDHAALRQMGKAYSDAFSGGNTHYCCLEHERNPGIPATPQKPAKRCHCPADHFRLDRCF